MKIILATISLICLLILAHLMISNKSFPSLDEFIRQSSNINSTSTGQVSNITENNSDSYLLSADSYEIMNIGTPKGQILAQVSNNPSKRQLGLSYRQSLEDGTGMVFIFPEPGRHSFWMKDMNFPIDIIWIRSDRRVMGITRNVSPDTYPETFYPPSDIQFVLELNAGESEKFTIATGTILKF